MKLPVILSLPILHGALSGCSPEPASPPPDVVKPAHDAADALPVVLTDPSNLALQDQLSGRLNRRGPCLYLHSAARSDLILWGDAVTAARDDEHDWVIVDNTTKQRFREGDRLVGGGGLLPDGLDIEARTPEEVPFECERSSALQLHSVEVGEPPGRNGGPPDPPPPPPAPPSIIESVRDAPDQVAGFPTYRIRGISDAREALFVHVVGIYRDSDHFGTRPICLTDADTATVARVSERYGNVHPDTRCDWQGGGVVFNETGLPALYIHAKVRCGGGTCAGEGGATYGNLGGEGHGYRLKRLDDGWSVEQTGISWIS